MDLAGKIRILPASGGNVKNFIHKKFSGRIAYYTILTINTLVNKSVNFPPLAGKIRILPARSTFLFKLNTKRFVMFVQVQSQKQLKSGHAFITGLN